MESEREAKEEGIATRIKVGKGLVCETPRVRVHVCGSRGGRKEQKGPAVAVGKPVGQVAQPAVAEVSVEGQASQRAWGVCLRSLDSKTWKFIVKFYATENYRQMGSSS